MFTHRESGKKYVGSSSNINSRKKQHLREVVSPKKHTNFARALREFGIDAFDFEILELCNPDKHSLCTAEDEWIARLDSTGLGGFNTLGKSTACALGRKASPATKERISKKMQDLWRDPESRERRITNIKLALSKPDVRQRMQVARADSEYRSERSRVMAKIRNTPEFISKMRASLSGDVISRRTESIRSAWTPEKRKSTGEISRSRYKNSAAREKTAQHSRDSWADPEIRSKRIAGLIESWRKKKESAIQ